MGRTYRRNDAHRVQQGLSKGPLRDRRPLLRQPHVLTDHKLTEPVQLRLNLLRPVHLIENVESVWKKEMEMEMEIQVYIVFDTYLVMRASTNERIQCHNMIIDHQQNVFPLVIKFVS
jgi:hypothetical protein